MAHRFWPAGLAALVLTALLACDDSTAVDRFALGDVEADGAAEQAQRADTAQAVRETGPAEIYYDLTIFDWYRHGEPLRAGSRTYMPREKPRAIPPDRLRRAGRFGDVDFYVPHADRPPYDSVFVPVFRGYWQRFLAVEAGQPLHAD